MAFGLTVARASAELIAAGIGMTDGVSSFWEWFADFFEGEEKAACSNIAKALARAGKVSVGSMSSFQLHEFKEIIKENGGNPMWAKSVEYFINTQFATMDTTIVPDSARLAVQSSPRKVRFNLNNSRNTSDDATPTEGRTILGHIAEPTLGTKLTCQNRMHLMIAPIERILAVCTRSGIITPKRTERLCYNDTKAAGNVLFTWLALEWGYLRQDSVIFQYIEAQLEAAGLFPSKKKWRDYIKGRVKNGVKTNAKVRDAPPELSLLHQHAVHSRVSHALTGRRCTKTCSLTRVRRRTATARQSTTRTRRTS